MTTRRTIERILQDGDDRQTQRSWSLSCDGDHIDIRRFTDGEFFLLFRRTDVPQLVADLLEIAAAPEDQPSQAPTEEPPPVPAHRVPHGPEEAPP